MKYNRVGALYTEGTAESVPAFLLFGRCHSKGAGVAHSIPGGCDRAVGALDLGDAERVDAAVEGIGDAADVPSDGGRRVRGGVGEGWFGGAPAPPPSAEPPPSLAQLTADIISAYVSNRFTPTGM